MLVYLFFSLFALVFVTLYIVYRLFKKKHRFVSTLTDLEPNKTFQLVHLEQINFHIDTIKDELLEDVLYQYDVYKDFSFKLFLLYLCYCLNEDDFKEDLYNNLIKGGLF